MLGFTLSFLLTAPPDGEDPSWGRGERHHGVPAGSQLQSLGPARPVSPPRLGKRKGKTAQVREQIMNMKDSYLKNDLALCSPRRAACLPTGTAPLRTQTAPCMKLEGILVRGRPVGALLTFACLPAH